MNEVKYYPDDWVVVRIDRAEQEPLYKILAGWKGGFADPDWWKLSSGCLDFETPEDGTFLSKQHSGSYYIMDTSRERVSELLYSVLSTYSEQLRGIAKIGIVTSDEVIEYFKGKK